MMRWLSSMLSENGAVSSVRFCMVAWFVIMFGAWTSQSIAARKLADIPASVLAFSTLMLGAKVGQKFTE